jgi:hypothetical protein
MLGTGAAVVLLDVGLEVVGVGDRPETWRQCGEGQGLQRVANPVGAANHTRHLSGFRHPPPAPPPNTGQEIPRPAPTWVTSYPSGDPHPLASSRCGADDGDLGANRELGGWRWSGRCLAHGVWRWLVQVPAQGTTATWTNSRWERRHRGRSWAATAWPGSRTGSGGGLVPDCLV